jgi:hypothetical protein
MSNWSPPAAPSRLELIDFLRGVAILEMLAAHYADYFPPRISHVVDSLETAMALFVVLAGFMVGYAYQKFAAHPRSESWVVWKRALRVVAIQYLLIVTIGIPSHLAGLPGYESGQTLGVFVFQSLTFLNQIGLLHILPTFVPLFLVSPAILFALARDWEVPLLLISAAVFCVGHFQPHLLDLGEHTIFPFVLFQFYFVLGSLLGKYCKRHGELPPPQPRRWLMASAALLLTTMLVAHRHYIPAQLIGTHPLNLLGLLYQAPILATIWLASLVLWPKIRGLRSVSLIERFGRHALLAFVIHVFLAKALGLLNYLAPPPPWMNYLLVALSVFLINLVLSAYERDTATRNPRPWTRAMHVLFR